MSKVVLYIAASLDGYIARPDGGIDWLESLPNPDQTDHGYAAFMETISCTIMGRKTYQEVLGFNCPWPYQGIPSYIISHNPDLEISTVDTSVYSGRMDSLISKLKETEKKDIWLIGGGQLITSFLNEELIDRMILFQIPLILGEGIPLFPGKPRESGWKLVESQSYSTGAVCSIYDRL